MSIWTELLGAQVRYSGEKYKTRVIELGQGHPLILLHGNGGHAENFVYNISSFAQHFRTFAIDLLWHGYSSKPQFNHSIIPSFIDQINDFMETESITSANFVGQSMGAWPVMELAISMPHKVRKLVLTTPQGFILDGENKMNLNERLSTIKERTLQALVNPTFENIRNRLERLVVNKQLITDEMVEVRYKIYNDLETNYFQKLFVTEYLGGEESGKHRIVQSRLGSILCPTLIYWSEYNSVPPAMGVKFAKCFPNSSYYCVKDTGHWAQFEHFEEYNQKVLDFLLS